MESLRMFQSKRNTFFILVFILLCIMPLQVKAQKFESPIIGRFKLIPTGEFKVDKNSATIMSVSSFFMAEKEVTREQYAAVMGLESPSDGDLPVDDISWYSAVVFCNKLSMSDGLTPVYSIKGDTDPVFWGDIPSEPDDRWNSIVFNTAANGYRLPTEAEWMWAAMGADTNVPVVEEKTKKRGTNIGGYNKLFAGYNWTNSIDNYAWIRSNARDTAHPVGTKTPNELGIYDMSGNAAEWCWDWYDTLPIYGNLSNYIGPDDNKGRLFSERVVKGGSWQDYAEGAKLTKRTSIRPEKPSAGIRVVRRKM